MENLTLGPIETIPHAQGSEEWMTERVKPGTCCGSEAAAAVGVSPHMKRDELIAKMAVGHEKEFSDYVRERVLARGHVSERAACEHLETELGELAPLTLARSVNGMRWLASLDGQTMDEETIFEHKDWNEELAAAVRRGEVPIDKACQLEHQLVTSSSLRVRFVCSDGTTEKRVMCTYESNPELRARVVAAWEQVLKEVAAYAPPAAAPAAVVARSITLLPVATANVVIVEGKLTVQHNLDELKPMYLAHINGVNTKLETDQQFVDADADAKYLREAADKLELGVEQLLGQMIDVNGVVAIMRELAKAADAKALSLEKGVTTEKENIKGREIQRGRQALAAHIADLNDQLGKPYMPEIPSDFKEAAKNQRTVASLRNKINTHLATCKIVANERFGVINKNLTWLRENAREYTGIFQHDTGVIVLKAHDDLVALATLRINEHKAAEEKKEEAQREKIRMEEVAKLQLEQQARDAAAAQDKERQEALDEMRALTAEAPEFARTACLAQANEALATATKRIAVPAFWGSRLPEAHQVRAALVEALELAKRDVEARVQAEEAQARQAAEAAKPAPTPAPAPIASPAVAPTAPAANSPAAGYLPLTTAQAPSPSPAANVVPMQRAAAPTTPPTMKLGDINTRLQHFATTEAGLAALGFPATKVKGACLYHEADWSRMLDSIVAHARMLQQREREAA